MPDNVIVDNQFTKIIEHENGEFEIQTKKREPIMAGWDRKVKRPPVIEEILCKYSGIKHEDLPSMSSEQIKAAIKKKQGKTDKEEGKK